MQNCHMIQAGEVQTIIGDASRAGVGGAQYAGVWSLTSIHRPFNAFGNSYAGLLPSEVRGKAPTLEVVDANTVVLRRRADDKHPSHCEARYQIKAPYYIDHQLTIDDQKPIAPFDGPGNYREIAWCNYMNSPQDPHLYFLSDGKWFRYMSPRHGVGSNIAPSYVPDPELEALPPQDEKSAWRHPFHVDRIPQRFDQPFYYGRLDDMALLFVFDKPRQLRFYLSPSGGGGSILPGMNCPAWDFEWVLTPGNYLPLKPRTFRVRMVYKKFVSNEDILEEVRRAQDELGFEKV
jgi:hypothetical protein